MSEKKRLYLPYAAWTPADRARWVAAFTPGTDPFDDDRGAGAHLAERTRLALQYSYAKFLVFLLACHEELLTRDPAERVDRKIIEEYVKWQPKTCGDVTIGNYLYHLWYALKYICPDSDWSWLLDISKRIAARGKRKIPKHHLVTSEALYSLGIELMDGVIIVSKPTVTRMMQTAYRDGLMIALLALIPLRRRTVAALQIDKHLVRSGNDWYLDIPGADVKTKRPLEFPLGRELSDRVDFYLNEIRCRIPGAGRHTYLWATSRGPMGDRMIYDAVRRRTRKALGFPVNLHRFRSAAATLWSIVDPVNVLGAKDLLGHASFATTETHYIMAHSRLAGRSLAKAIGKIMQGEERAD